MAWLILGLLVWAISSTIYAVNKWQQDGEIISGLRAKERHLDTAKEAAIEELALRRQEVADLKTIKGKALLLAEKHLAMVDELRMARLNLAAAEAEIEGHKKLSRNLSAYIADPRGWLRDERARIEQELADQGERERRRIEEESPVSEGGEGGGALPPTLGTGMSLDLDRD